MLRWSFAMNYEIKLIYFPFIKVGSAYDLLKGVIKEALKPFLIILRIWITTDYVPQFGNFISKMNCSTAPMHLRLTDDSKLVVGVSVSPVIDLVRLRDVPGLSPTLSWDRLKHLKQTTC